MRRQESDLACRRVTGAGLKLGHVFSIAVLLSLLVPAAKAQQEQWVTYFGTNPNTGGIEATVNVIEADDVGGVFVAGETRGDLGGANAGSVDCFVMRFDRWGIVLWIIQFGTSGGETVEAIALDGAGGCYVSGSTSGLLAGPGGGIQEAFVARYDQFGNQIWLRQFGDALFAHALGLSSDGSGGVYVAGGTTSSEDGTEAFLARYDSSGERIWYRKFRTGVKDVAWDVTPDGAGGVFVSGYTRESWNQPFPQTDAFLARFDQSGNQTWVRTFGTSYIDNASNLAPDGKGGVFVGGKYDDRSGGKADVFVARYDAQGNEIWLRQFGSSTVDYLNGLAPDGTGGVFVGGSTYGNLGGTHFGESDCFLARYDSAGTQVSMMQFGTAGGERGGFLAADDADGVFFVGFKYWDPVIDNAAFLAHYSDVTCFHADCDQSTGVGVLDMLDFLCFQSAFVVSAPYACQCDTSTGPDVCDVFDFLCFQEEFVAGCP